MAKAALKKALVKHVEAMSESNKARQTMELLMQRSLPYVTETPNDNGKTVKVKVPKFKRSNVTYHVESHTTVHIYAQQHDGPVVNKRYAQVVFPTVVNHEEINVKKGSGEITVEVPKKKWFMIMIFSLVIVI